MYFLNIFLFFFFIKVEFECSRILSNPIKKIIGDSSKSKTLTPSRKFSTAVPRHQPASSSNFKQIVRLSAFGAGLVSLGLSTRTTCLNEQNYKPVKRVSFDLPDSNGRTPIFNAISNDDKEAFNRQLHLGADLNVRDKKGVTLMELALEKGYPEYYEALIKSGRIDMSQLDSQGHPYLFTAISNRRFLAANVIMDKFKIAYDRELLKEMMYLACYILPETGVALKDRPEQLGAILNLFALSKCDRQMVRDVLNDLEPHQMDPKIRKSVLIALNDIVFKIYFGCLYGV